MRQHLANPEKQHLTHMRVFLGDLFNKSAALDLESFLIQRFAGDGQFNVLNRNEGVTNANYYDRLRYEVEFERIFDELYEQGLFAHTLPEIENSDLFKLSPFKSLNSDQMFAINDILRGLFSDLAAGRSSTISIQGDPGTGKTIVGIYLMKMLEDIKAWSPDVDDVAEQDNESPLAAYFTHENAQLLAGFTLGLVVPQQSLRDSIARVFKRTPGLHPRMVMTPFTVGKSEANFDLLIVDESHRLTQRANQSSGPLNKTYADITERLFGNRDDFTKTQVDWIQAKSTHQLFLMDIDQTVRPMDIPAEVLEKLQASTHHDDPEQNRSYVLSTQMRVKGGADYIRHAKHLLTSASLTTEWPAMGDYDFRVFDNLSEMREAILKRDDEVGLSRLLSGYGFDWKSKNDSSAADIELDGLSLQWNTSATDWVNKAGSVHEVGSIHTIQGYDLNYAGVIFAPELRFDPETQEFRLDRSSYFDAKGKENSPKLGRIYGDDDLLTYVKKIYGVLLTRGMRGTYVYAATPEVRDFLRALPVPASNADAPQG